MKFKKIFHGRALYAEKSRIWVARGMTFFAVDYDGICVTRKYKVGGMKAQLLSISRPVRQLLREGLHHLLPIPNGDLLVTVKRKTYIVGRDGSVKSVFTGYLGNKPGHRGICITPEGTIFFGEYTLNPKRDHDTRLYRSTDGGMSFDCVLTLPMNEVRHIHFIQYDSYEKCLWLGTGDEDHECKLMKSTDNGNTWQTVGAGSQKWRAIGMCFDQDYMIWGTDAGSVPDPNYVIRMHRSTCDPEIIGRVEGPCHSCGSFKDGRIFISTGVEGGKNEKDRFAHLKTVNNGTVEDINKLKKDLFPLILQYGVIRFPLGTENTDRVVYTTYGLSMNGEAVFVEE